MEKRAVVEKPDSRFSNKVTILSFVMAIFVICIHANNLKYYGLESAAQSLDYNLVKILADVIGGMAVPFFFMMSGYWFYRGLDLNSQTSWKEIANKERKKIQSLAVPYLLWNAFGMVFYMVLTRIPVLASAMNSGGEVIPVTLTNVIKGIFAHEYYFTFWYMQDLIIITFVIAPLLLLLLRSKPVTIIAIVILLTLSVLDLNLPFVETSSVLCFTIGGGYYILERMDRKEKKQSAPYYALGNTSYMLCPSIL